MKRTGWMLVLMLLAACRSHKSTLTGSEKREMAAESQSQSRLETSGQQSADTQTRTENTENQVTVKQEHIKEQTQQRKKTEDAWLPVWLQLSLVAAAGYAVFQLLRVVLLKRKS